VRGLGWVDGRNVRIDVHWTRGSVAETRKHAAELAALAPDVILTTGANAGAMLQASNIIPIVFVIVPDPVGAGFVASLSRPGGNATGFMQFEYNLSGKRLELLNEVAPSVTRAAILRDPATSAGIGQFAVIQSVESLVRIDVSPVSVREPTEIELAETRKHAAELAALAPDVILTTGANAGAMLQASNIIPIVFVIVPDPVGAGFVASLSRPGGDATGFMQFEYNLSGKKYPREICGETASISDPCFSASKR
jgi:ABC-type uncharacterized transport system substrate-binding protein